MQSHGSDGGARVRWGILGPGKVARDFHAGAAGSRTGTIVAIGTRDPDRPGLRDAFPGTRIVAGYEALLADPGVDAIYIATPHPGHARWAIAAATAQRHVLCEKPMGMTAAEVRAMVDAARRAGTFLGEAFMYRFHPLTRRIVDILRSGVIGEVRMIRSSFGFALPAPAPRHRLFARDLGGGAILDVGGYPASMVRLIAGCRGADAVAEPDRVEGLGHVGATGVDEWAAAMLSFPDGIVAQLSGAISLRQDNVLHVMGAGGRLEVDHFWFAGGKTGGTAAIRLILADGRHETIAVAEPRNIYAFQFEAANAAIRSGRGEFAWPGPTHADSLGNAAVLDRWLAGVGQEQAEALQTI